MKKILAIGLCLLTLSASATNWEDISAKDLVILKETLHLNYRNKGHIKFPAGTILQVLSFRNSVMNAMEMVLRPKVCYNKKITSGMNMYKSLLYKYEFGGKLEKNCLLKLYITNAEYYKKSILYQYKDFQ